MSLHARAMNAALREEKQVPNSNMFLFTLADSDRRSLKRASSIHVYSTFVPITKRPPFEPTRFAKCLSNLLQNTLASQRYLYWRSSYFASQCIIYIYLIK